MGSLDEAIQLWEAQRGRTRGENDGTPEGWEYVGSGGTRVVYKAPSGVCYKVCHNYDDEDESHNDVELRNMKRIEREGKLPPKWRLPKMQLHVFPGQQRRWDFRMQKESFKSGRIAILATEYIEGEELSWQSPTTERAKQEAAFDAVGLSDTGGANAIKAKTGEYYIVDAAEWMEPEKS